MKLTTIGLYNYDNTLFDGLTFPTGIDKDLAVNTILIRSGEFEVLYPQLDFFKSQIGFWGQKHYRTFDKWVKALAVEYDPLYNYDRTEEYEDTRAKTEARTENVNNTSSADTTTDGSKVVLENNQQGVKDDTTERSVSGYDSSGYVPSEKDVRNATTTDNTQSTDSSTTKSETSGTSDTTTAGTGTESEKSIHKAHLYGNIGVTTSQQMLKDELDVQRFNIYDNIADLFVDEFCILIY